MCLWCSERGKSFGSVDAVRKHMRDKGHCRLAHGEADWLEYADWFDFSASYPDGAEVDAGDDALPAFAADLEVGKMQRG